MIARPELTPEEFAFPGLNRLSDEEKEECCRCEHFRESYIGGGKVRDLVIHLRRAVAAQEPTGLAAALLFDCFGDIEGFPQTPWLKFDPAIRANHLKLARALAAESGWALVLRLETRTDEASGAKSKQDFQLWKTTLSAHPGTVCGWFMIRPGSRQQMVAQFRRELDQLSKKYPHLCVRERGGADTPTARLHQLGALRLLKHFTVPQILRRVDAHPARSGFKYPYNAEKGYREAKKKALDRLKVMDNWAQAILSGLRF